MQGDDVTRKGQGLRVFASNSLWMMLAEIVAKLASLALVIILARGLEVAEYGQFNFAISFASLILLFGRWGLHPTLVADLARNRERVSELFSSGLVVRSSLAVAGLLLAVGLAPLFVDGSEAFLVVSIVTGAVFLDELSAFVGVVFKGFERMKFNGLLLITNRLVSTGLAFAVVLRGGSLLTVCVVYFVGSLSALLMGWVALMRYFPPIKLRDARKDLAATFFRQGLLLGLAMFLNMALFRLDAIMLGVLRGAVAVGLYGVAYRFFESFLFVAWTLSSAALPRFARSATPRDTMRTFELVVALVIAFYLPLAVGSLFAGDWVIVTLFGDRYATAASALAWLTFAGVFYGIAYWARIAVVTLGRRTEVVWVAAFSLLVNFAINVYAIPRHGFVAAAVATCITEVLEAALLVRIYVRTANRRDFTRVVAIPVVGSGLMGLALWAAGLRGSMAIAVGLVTYVVVVGVAGRVLAPSESRAVWNLVRRRKPESVAAPMPSDPLADPAEG